MYCVYAYIKDSMPKNSLWSILTLTDASAVLKIIILSAACICHLLKATKKHKTPFYDNPSCVPTFDTEMLFAVVYTFTYIH